jgi:hypothetical protein
MLGIGGASVKVPEMNIGGASAPPFSSVWEVRKTGRVREYEWFSRRLV